MTPPDAPGSTPPDGVAASSTLAGENSSESSQPSADTGAVAPGANSPEPSPVPPTRKGLSDKEGRILRAAALVFAEHGYHATRMTHVAKRAGVATGTIYLYFKSKTDLLVRLFNRSLGEYLTACRPILTTTPPGVERLAMLVAMHLRFFDGNRALASVFLLNVREPDPEIQSRIAPTVTEFFTLIEDVVKSGADYGDFAADLDVRMMRKIVFGALDEVVVGWLRTGCNYELLTLAHPLATMLCRAAGATRAPEPVTIAEENE